MKLRKTYSLPGKTESFQAGKHSKLYTGGGQPFLLTGQNLEQKESVRVLFRLLLLCKKSCYLQVCYVMPEFSVWKKRVIYKNNSSRISHKLFARGSSSFGVKCRVLAKRPFFVQ